jgi:hypothetical protein
MVKQEVKTFKFKTKEEDLKFEQELIEFVKDHPLVYDKKHPDYPKNEEKLKAFEEFKLKYYKDSELNVEQIDNKWRSLKTAFTREYKLQNPPTGLLLN